uniref:DUF218 domain-containing protein n=1 Tax=Vitrella brassicaformis TaxID=1169539 RepID=A0A7S1P5G0_9ALVE|mmetsp:Transcript_37663/g.94477  ORF Transcript_37663/g.94477 Transcript_37663/m.94477 type:complete len:189 (+) Transcript_37663:62-628(+)
MAQSCCMSKTQRKSEDEPPMYDAVIIPGGGVDQQGVPHPWVVERLKRALTLDKQTKYYILLSRGTTHKAPPLDSEGVPIDEAAAGAKYLAEHGVSTDRILMERWSLDTIGNIYALRRLITEPMDMRSLVFVTNEFHMNRTRESVYMPTDGHTTHRLTMCVCVCRSCGSTECPPCGLLRPPSLQASHPG